LADLERHPPTTQLTHHHQSGTLTSANKVLHSTR
jgi:hypothetical protein